MTEIQITPRDGDVMQIAIPVNDRTIPPRSSRVLEARLLTDVGLFTTRELTITYYMWGRPFTLRTTAGN